jgi:hypothetical protein
MSKGSYIIVWRCAPYRLIVTSELVRLLSRWPWNTLRNYMCGVSLVAGRSKGSAIRWGAWSADCGGWVGRETVNRKRKLSAVFLQPIQNPSYMSHVLLLCILFLSVKLYFIYVWHVYVTPKTYKCFGTIIIKDGRYTFTFFETKRVKSGSETNSACYSVAGTHKWLGINRSRREDGQPSLYTAEARMIKLY